MLRDAAVTRIQRIIGFRSDRSLEIIDALQDAQVVLERSATLPWFLLTEVSSIATVNGEERVPYPTDFLREWEDDAIWYFNGAAPADEDKWTELAKDDLDELRNNLPGEGAPEAYATDGLYVRVFPTPDDVYTLKQIYYKKDQVLSSDIENLWLENFPFLMIGKAGSLLPPAFVGLEAGARFSLFEQQGLAQLFVENEARKHAGRRYIMGGPD